MCWILNEIDNNLFRGHKISRQSSYACFLSKLKVLSKHETRIQRYPAMLNVLHLSLSLSLAVLDSSLTHLYFSYFIFLFIFFYRNLLFFLSKYSCYNRFFNIVYNFFLRKISKHLEWEKKSNDYVTRRIPLQVYIDFPSSTIYFLTKLDRVISERKLCRIHLFDSGNWVVKAHKTVGSSLDRNLFS